jgi:nicotinamide mononucleotide (NMN) deamidase PncC
MDQCNQLAATLVARLRVLGLYVTTVESCTGGGLVNCITNVYIAVVVRDQIYRETLCLGAGASERWEAKCEVIAHALQMTLDLLDAMDGSSSA